MTDQDANRLPSLARRTPLYPGDGVASFFAGNAALFAFALTQR